MFELFTFLFKFRKVRNDASSLAFIKPVLRDDMGGSHCKNGWNGHWQLITDKVLNRIQVHQFRSKIGGSGGRCVTDGQYACNDRSRGER